MATAKARKGRLGRNHRRLANSGGYGGLVEEVVDWFDPSRDTENNAAKVSAGFHGRDAKTITEVEEIIEIPKNYADLGRLVQLDIITANGDGIFPIYFGKSKHEQVRLACSTDRSQLYFIGGNQSFDWQAVCKKAGIDNTYKHYVEFGYVKFITYYADKWHLEGPKSQEQGCEYIHEFGEQGGIPPMLVYDTVNERMLLVGGSYEVRDEGIWD